MIISLNSDPVLQYGTEHNGGQSKYVLELGKNLVREGWELDVFTIKNPKDEEVLSITEGFTIYRFPLPHNESYSYQITKQDIDAISDSIISFIKDNSCMYDLILCCYWVSGLVGLKIKSVLGVNALITFCSLGCYKIPNDNVKFRIEQETFIAHNIDHIIATSNEEKKILVDLYKVIPNKITVIPRGVDTNKFCKIYDL